MGDKQCAAGLAKLIGEATKGAPARARGMVNPTGRVIQRGVGLLQLEAALDGLVRLAAQLFLVNPMQFKVRKDFLQKGKVIWASKKGYEYAASSLAPNLP
jgi:hypothetical protein